VNYVLTFDPESLPAALDEKDVALVKATSLGPG